MSQSSPYSWWSPGEDPEDEELGIGVFRYPDGNSRYGQDAEGAAALRQAGKVGPPPGDVLPPGMQDPNEYGPPQPPATRNEPTESKSGDLRRELEAPSGVDIPVSSRLAHVNNNPGNLRFAGQSGARQGEGGFAAFDSPEDGAAALYRQIDLDASRGMSLKQFVNKYAPPSENDTVQYVKQMTEFTGASEDTPISQIDRDKLAQAVARKESSSTLGGSGGQFETKLAPADEQLFQQWKAKNAPEDSGADYDLRGAFKAGLTPGPDGHWPDTFKKPNHPTFSDESIYARGRAAGHWNGDQYMPAGSSRTPPGLALAEVSQTGSPLTPQQMQEREGQYNAQATQEREARGAALLDQRQALQNVQDQQVQVAQQREQQAKADQQREDLVQKEASQRIDTELMQPVQRLDPKRYIKNMSTAQQVFGVLGLLTSAVGQTFLQMNGQNAQNYAMQWLDKSIDQDIQAQLEEIRQGEVSTKNRVAHWTRVFDNAEAGKTAAKLEAEQAVNSRLKANLLDVDDANLQAQAVAVDQEIQKRALDSVNALRENEANKIRMRYEAPKVAPRPVGPVPTGANDPIKTDPAYRAQVAAHFDEAKDGEKLDKFKAGMDKVNALRATKKELEELYRVQPNAQGAYPTEGNYDSSATGIDPFDALDDLSDAGATRNRRLAKAWEGVRIASRSEWKTEPNGQQIQERFQNLGVPDRDADVPLALQRLNDTLTQAENLLESGTLPQVRAYFWSQQGPPVGASRVTGRIP